jgi:HD superfamily phosphohydrolase
MSGTEKDIDSDSGLFTIYDAVHGAISLKDPIDSKSVGNIVRLLNSPMVERLRRIKQLGYASHSYTAADHSRYAHAIGTMHMMKSILKHIDSRSGFRDGLYEDLCHCFPQIFIEGTEQEIEQKNKNVLIRHMIVAALLQDVGELPYGKATGMIFKPKENLLDSVKKEFSMGKADLSNKDIFTLGCIQTKASKEILRELEIDKEFLAFLITGQTAKPEDNQRGGLRQLRHMLDGEIDADRLDYVFRDAYHTVGGFGMPKTVIKSLLFYDEVGPVFSDTGP